MFKNAPGPPPHRSLLSVGSHSKGARAPSGVFASLQGLLWPDFFLVVPTIPLEAQRGYCLQGALEASRSSKKSCLSWVRLKNRLRHQHDPPALEQPFFGEDRALSQAHTHACTLCKLPQPPTHPEQPLGTTPQSGTYRAPMRSATPTFHKHTGVHTHMWHTHRAGIGSLWGARQGGFSAVVAQEVGRLDPSFGRDPVKMMAGVGLPGPSPRAIISQATWPC